jgi:LAO/AO transport system kinase
MPQSAPERASIQDLARRLVEGERRALARAITLVESTRADHQQAARVLLDALLPRTGGAIRVGISGVPGVGKSTFIDAFGTLLVENGKRVAVLAVDPSSSISGGSILGDKTRMPRLAASPRAFVRPSPSQGSLGGVARRTREALLVCEAAGYDVIVIETVGVGQSEYAVAGMVDVFLLLMLAGAGDELQGIKRGILELADVIAITKADGDNERRAESARAEYKAALRLLRGAHEGGAPEVLAVSATLPRGIDRVWESVLSHRAFLERTSALGRKRAEQQKSWLFTLLEDGLRERFFSRSDVQRALPEIERAVERAEMTPTEGARRLLEFWDPAATHPA